MKLSSNSPSPTGSSGINQQWWADQWLDLINRYRFKKRLERGWKYAREGHVLSIRFEDQSVLAIVQGTDPEPYRVSIGLDPLTDEDWAYVITNLSQRSLFAAKLLAGEMPLNIEEVFAASGLRLFPFQLSEVRSNCSCPDKANPCKHISAVYYLLGDRFREDPFVLFQLRGRTRSQILEALRQQRSQQSSAPIPLEAQNRSTTTIAEAGKPQINLDRFWRYEAPLDPALVVIVPPPDLTTPLDVLGAFPLPVVGAYTSEEIAAQQAQMQEALKTVYQQVAQQALIQGMV